MGALEAQFIKNDKPLEFSTQGPRKRRIIPLNQGAANYSILYYIKVLLNYGAANYTILNYYIIIKIYSHTKI